MSQPPNYPGSPNEPWGGNQNPGGYRRRPTTAHLLRRRLRRTAPAAGLWRAAPPPPGYGPPPPRRLRRATSAARIRAAARLRRPAIRRSAIRRSAIRRSEYGGQPFSIGEAFNWAWNKFSKNAAALIVPDPDLRTRAWESSAAFCTPYCSPTD